MARDVRPLTVACWEDEHDKCRSDDCYCECHKPEDEPSARFKLKELAKATMPDSQRLQVLIHLIIELDEERR